MKFINRTLIAELQEMKKSYPVVTVVGPRQSGKTTLVQHVFPDKPYLSLEDPDVLAFAEEDPRAFIEKHHKNGMICDEIQRFPELLSYIQGYVDKDKRKGHFIITGSHQLALHASIAQSLAGRTAILKLLPLSIDELDRSSYKLDDYLYKGFYPRIHQDRINPTKFYRDYVQTYLEKDVRSLINVKDLRLFQKFLKLCAGRVGQLFNAQALSNEVGVTYHTIQNWLSVLEASFITYTLPPFYENFNKRLIKTPKIYFTDIGLACYLLDITTPEQLNVSPFRGALVENLVIMDVVKACLNKGQEPPLFFYRDQHGHEVDLIYKKGHKFIPIEIKSSTTFNAEFIKNLTKFSELAGKSVIENYLVYGGTRTQKIATTQVINYKHLVRELFNQP